MRVAIMQPGYLPWLGFFELMSRCDLFVIFDDVQYTKKDWRSRNRIRTKDGWQWLSVPVHTKHHRFQLISEAKIDHSSNWQHKHLKAIEVNYSGAPFFSEYYAALHTIISLKWEYLVDLDLELIRWLAAEFGIRQRIIRSSGLGTTGKREDKIMAVCDAVNACELYDSAAAAGFLDVEAFRRRGIRLVFQDYPHPFYRQRYSPFVPFMSALDLLLNHGPASGGIILGKTV